LSKIIHEFKNYKKVILGDREFCGVDLAKWLKEQENTRFVLRVKKNEYFQKNQEWKALKD
jgi:hypothetical protein